MKKKFINGFLMVALLFAATSSFVSCKDNIDDDISPLYNALAQRSAELQQKIDSLKQVIENHEYTITNITNYIDSSKHYHNGDTTIINYGDTTIIYYGDTTIINQIIRYDTTLNIINQQIINQTLAIDSINNVLNFIDDRINGLSDSVKILWNQVELILQKLEGLVQGNFITSVSIDGTRNDVFGILNLPGIQAKALAAYYGTNDNTIDKFPYAGYDFNVGGREFASYLEKDELPYKDFVTFEGDKITDTYGNAGQIFFTINSNDYENLDISKFTTVTVENSAGEVSPIKLGNFRKSSARITWGLGKQFFTETGNKSDNGMYVADATIAEKDLDATRFGFEKFIDLKSLQKELRSRIDDIRAVEGENGDVSKTAKFKNFIREAAGLVFGLFQPGLTEYDYKTNASYSPQRLAFFTEKDGKLVRKGQTNIELMTTAVKPLSYNTFWEYEKTKDGNWIIEEQLEKAISRIAQEIKERWGGYGISAKIVGINESEKTVTLQFNSKTETIVVSSTQYWEDLKKAINANGGLDVVNWKLAKLLSTYSLGQAATSAAERINTYLDKASDKLSEFINKHLFTRAIAPIIIFETTTGMDRLCEGMFINRGTMHAYLTSGTMELLAPAYKKYVALKKSGTLLQSEVLPGNTQTYDFDLSEKGDYVIILSCVDYFGYVITKKYNVHVN
jgi:hypothetical protein